MENGVEGVACFPYSLNTENTEFGFELEGVPCVSTLAVPYLRSSLDDLNKAPVPAETPQAGEAENAAEGGDGEFTNVPKLLADLESHLEHTLQTGCASGKQDPTGGVGGIDGVERGPEGGNLASRLSHKLSYLLAVYYSHYRAELFTVPYTALEII